MDDWRKEFQYLLDRKILSRDELAYLFGQIDSIVVRKTKELEAKLKQHRWKPADEPPDNIGWDKKVQVLEYESSTPIVMTMAEVFLDEGSEVEYWKPIILPE